MRTEVHTPVLLTSHKLWVQLVQIDHPFESVERILTALPQGAGMVVFVHSRMGACRASHNRFLNQFLTQRNFVVLEVGLPGEEETAGTNLAAPSENDPMNLTGQLVACAQWVRQQHQLRRLPLGILEFGLGGTSALMAAAALTGAINALAVADALPDVVGARLGNILAPTLLLVSDTSDIHRRLKEIACAQLRCEKDLEIVTAARALVNGEGCDRAGTSATTWFQRYLRPRADLVPGPVMN